MTSSGVEFLETGMTVLQVSSEQIKNNVLPTLELDDELYKELNFETKQVLKQVKDLMRRYQIVQAQARDSFKNILKASLTVRGSASGIHACS